MSLVELRRYRTRIDGEIARTFLESNGIHAVLFDAESLGYADGFPVEVRLMVLDEEQEDAAAILTADS
jgi:putative signal transducing protein